MALDVASPEILLSVRFLIAFAILNVIVASGRAALSLKGKRLLPLVGLGVMEPIYFYFESYGILYTNATYAGVVLAVAPVAGLLAAALFLAELYSF